MFKTILGIVMSIGAFGATLTTANAATVTFIETGREEVGTPNAGEIANTGPGLNISAGLPGGTLSSGDQIDIFGFLTTGTDAVTLTADQPFELIATRLFFSDSAGRFTTTITAGDMGMVELGATTNAAPIFALPAGTYTFLFDQVNSTAMMDFDISFVGGGAPVPVPAALPLMGFGLAGMGAIRRRRRAPQTA